MRRRKDCRRKRCVWQTKCGHDGGYGGDDYGYGYNCKKVKVIKTYHKSILFASESRIKVGI